MSLRAMIQLTAVAVGLAVLSNCGGNPAPIYQQAFGYNCYIHDGPTARKLCKKNTDPGAAQVSRYCYHTIADPNCFDRPDPDSKKQVLGSSGY